MDKTKIYWRKKKCSLGFCTVQPSLLYWLPLANFTTADRYSMHSETFFGVCENASVRIKFNALCFFGVSCIEIWGVAVDSELILKLNALWTFSSSAALSEDTGVTYRKKKNHFYALALISPKITNV